jgi:hypothetical protein
MSNKKKSSYCAFNDFLSFMVGQSPDTIESLTLPSVNDVILFQHCQQAKCCARGIDRRHT